MKTALLTFIFIISGLWGISQTTYTWDGSTNTDWQVAANWTPNRTLPAASDLMIINSTGAGGATKSITNIPTNQTVARLTITGNVTVTLSAPGGVQTLTIGGSTGDDLVVSSGSTLIISNTLNNIVLPTNASADISGTYTNNSNYNITATSVTTVTGTFNNAGVFTGANNASKLIFSAGGTYVHGQNGGTVPTAAWNATSNCNFTGLDDAFPNGLAGQSFGNVLFASDIDNGNIEIDQSFTTQGNLTVSNTGADDLRFSNNPTPVITVGVTGNFSMTSGNIVMVSDDANVTVNVTGNFSHSGGVFTMKDNNGAAALNITGNFSQTAGTFNIRTDNTSTSIMDVNGNFSVSGGTYNMSSGGGGGGGIGELNVAGNFSILAGGTITETTTSGSIDFDGTAPQVYTSGGTISNTINFTLLNGSTLQMAVAGTIVTGASFTNQIGSTLGIRSTAGIVTAPTASGNIQSTARTFSTGANYIYNGTAAQVAGNGLTQNIPANLTIDNPTTVSLSANTTISGNLLISSGTFVANGFVPTVGGNWTNNSAFTPGATGNVVMNGAGAQIIDGSVLTTFTNLNLNKTTGTVSLGQSVDVTTALNIGVNLILGTHNLTMGASAANIGNLGAAPLGLGKMIVASGTGQLRKIFNAASPVAYAFPIGDNTAGDNYSPALILFSDPTNSQGFVGVNVTDAKHPNNGHVNSFLSRYWTVTQSGLTTFTAQVGFTYVDADINGTEANIRLGKWDGQGPWTRYGAGSMNNPLNSMLSDAVGSFSDFSGLDFLEILPVNFGKFRGWAPNTSTNTIEWEVFAETGVDKYEIEKLSSGDVFRSIGVQSPSNNGLDLTYTFNDNAPNGGDNFYRIKATELTGEITYSPVIRVRNGGVTATAMKVYPNPVTGSTVNISLQGIKAGKYEMVVSNNAGQIIYRSSTEQRAGNVMIQIPVGNTLPKGIYRVKVSNGENVMLSSFIKE
jgi:hypothetical protein